MEIIKVGKQNKFVPRQRCQKLLLVKGSKRTASSEVYITGIYLDLLDGRA